MTRKEFIQVLDKEGYSYGIEGDKIVVTYLGSVNLELLEELPPGVVFENGGNVILKSLKELPPGVVFKNSGEINLMSLEVLHPGVVFKNRGSVWLESLEVLPPGVEFKNGVYVDLESLIGCWLDEWKGNIEGIDSKRLLNVMIKRGMFI